MVANNHSRCRGAGAFVALVAALAMPGCSSVELPEEQFYRLAYPVPAGGPVDRAGVLRLERLELAAHLAGDRLLVAEGPVSLRPYHFHRWAGSLEMLVGDALMTGLTRAHAFARVKGPGDPGDASLLLTGRVLELHHALGGGPNGEARVALHLELFDQERGQVVFQEEFRSVVPVADPRPDTVVRGLSSGLATVVDRVLVRARQAGVFDPDAAAVPPK